MRILRIILMTGLVWLAAGCSEAAPAVLQPAGPAAVSIARLGWIFIVLGSIIFLATMGYLVYALARPRPEAEDRKSGTMIVIVAGMIVPAVILLVLFVLNTNALGQASAPPQQEDAIVIEVSGRQWWWQIHYPEGQFYTANEIHIPVGQPVLLKLMSEDVIHSFWVPELHGKQDLIPGRVNEFWIQADVPGEYTGLCAEYCGTQHAKMLFRVVAEEGEAYAGWFEQMQQPAVQPESGARRGRTVFLEANCIQCHTIRGTDATGILGPDLTHLASRSTIGGGILSLNRANLSGWISNPQAMKPGAKMPASNLSGEDLNALVDYLLTLE